MRAAVTAFVFVATALLAAAVPASAQPGPQPNATFQNFIEAVWPDAQAAGVTRATFDRAFEGVTPDMALPDLVLPGKQPSQVKGQAEFVRPPQDYLNKSQLAQLATNGKSQLASSFSRDSMFVAIETYQGRSSVVTPLPAGALLTPGMVERIVELLPLEIGFRTGATIVLFEMGAPRAVPAEVRVDAEEPLMLPDRTVNCWVVVLRAGALEERLWVSRDSLRVVKTEQVTGAGVLTAVLQP